MKPTFALILLITFFSSYSQEPTAKDTTTLKTVIVTGTKNPFTFKNGNVQVNVDNSTLSSIPDPLDLLAKIPGVQVARDGSSLSVVGKGEPLIYIDNQKISMEDVRSLNVADIKTIELVNNPSAKYEANGRTVLIIRRKVIASEGVKGELSQVSAYRKYYLNRNSANISLRKSKLELKSDFQINELKTWEGNDFDFILPSHNIRSGYKVTAVTTRKPQVIGSVGVFYQFNEQDYISASSNTRHQNDRFPIYTQSFLEDNNNAPQVVETANVNKQPISYQASNVKVNKQLKKLRTNLFAGAQYTSFRKTTASEIFNAYNDDPQFLEQYRMRDAKINVIASRVDLETKVNSQIKIETGINTSLARSSGYSNIHSYILSNDNNARFSYKEKNTAAYGQFSGTWKKVQWSSGVRAEVSDVKSVYTSPANHSEILRNTTQWFPKAKVSISIDTSSSVSISYSKSITRPDYTNADQTAIYINPYFEWTNNINLSSTITDEIAATFQYRKYALALSMYKAGGPVYSNFEFNEQQLILRRSEMNYQTEHGWYASATVPFRYKLWSSTNVMTAIMKSVRDPHAVTATPKPFVYFTTSNEFAFAGQWIFTIGGWAVSRSHQGLVNYNSYFSVDSSLTKKVDKVTYTLRFNNMFRSVSARESFNVNDVAASGIFRDNSRELAFSVKYNFGKLKETKFSNKEVDESGSRVR